ncbi:GNAT family N-acetyltransferase [Ligilactobacillus sp. LYQ60]|uniref:GNAT family N-acetyltransferase n=1 Tax=Ligilactobacillus sp. LYQ60 TaxID=3378799 RepID=UPI00385261A3
MHLRHAIPSDQSAIMAILTGAIIALKRTGSPQWQNGYPNDTTITTDIKQHVAYVLEKDQTVIGYAALVGGPDPNYLHINGQWLTSNTNYCTIHRVALAQSIRRQGMATPFLTLLLAQAKQDGYQSVRIDTHRLNLPMQKTAINAGFIQCGMIKIINDPTDPNRIAYEQLLTPTNNHH